MKKRVEKVKGLFLVMLVASMFMVIATPEEAKAVPSFARQQEQACTLCHWAFPKLNESGADYKFRGYRFKAEEGKDVWALDTWPISFVGEIEALYNDDTAKNGAVSRKQDVKIEEVEFILATPIGKKWSTFGEAAVEYDSASDSYEIGIATLFLTYHFYDDGKLNIRVRQFPIEFTYLTEKMREIIHNRPLAADPAVLGFFKTQKGIEINGQLLAPKGSKMPTYRYYLGLVRGEAEATSSERGLRNPSWYGTFEVNWLGQNLGLHYRQGREDRGSEGDVDTKYLTVNTELNYKYNPVGDFKLLLAYWQKEEQDWGGAGQLDVKYPTYTANLYYKPEFMKELILGARYDTLKVESDDASIDGMHRTAKVLSATYFFTPNIYFGFEVRDLDSGVTGIGTAYPSTISSSSTSWNQSRYRAFLVAAF
ncbi:MAG: hypothetical protein HY878_06995 [Deltaproteobacteria bacterium]|nr:hypothetical protein [Deltaproteobacteria bacterium]